MNIGKYPSTFITATEVGEFVNSYSLSRRGFSKNGEIFRDLLGNLDAISMILESDAEHALHEVFGLKGSVDECIKELQLRIDGINNSVLKNFTSYQLNECMRSHNELQGSNKNTQEIIEGLEKYLISKSPELLEITNYEERLYFAFKKAIESGRETKSNSTGKPLEGVSQYRLRAHVHDIVKSINNESIKRVSRAYKKDIIIFLQKEAEKNGDDFLSSTWSVSMPDIAENDLDLLAYYPYFNLTPEQEMLARDIHKEPGRTVWYNFKNRIINIACADPNIKLSRTAAEVVFDQLEPMHFITKNLNVLKGIFGEIQAGFILSILFGDRYTIAMTGKIPNIENQQLDVDIVLNKNIGIQVKNYSGYQDKEGNQLGYHLSDDLNWINFINKSVTGEIMTLSQYISTFSYNQPVTDATSDYKILYNNLTAKNNTFNNILNATLAANLEAFFPISDILLHKNPMISEAFKNVFFIFGGEKIIPTYKIFRLLHQRVEELQKLLEQNKTTEFMNLRSNTTYNGPVWNETDTYQSIQNILQHVRIYIDLNIYLTDLMPK